MTLPAPADNDEDLGLGHAPGDAHYRAYVGPSADYDLVAAMAFNLLTVLGLRQHHRLLDIGCGSLRVGRLLIPYLNRGGYCGLDPNAWLLRDGVEREVGHDQMRIKQARLIEATDAAALVAENARFDYMLAQSIFSHTGKDLLGAWLDQAAVLLADTGALVATYLPALSDTTRRGWIYPDCIEFSNDSLDAMAWARGLCFRPLDWHHPRQSWALFAKPGFPGLDTGLPLTWNDRFAAFDTARQAPDDR